MNYAKADEVDGERLINDNPVDVLSQKRIDRRIKPRERSLSEKELEALFVEMGIKAYPQYGKTKCSFDAMDLIMLIIYTGLRRNEASSLRWENVDFANKLFIIHDTKNRREHIVPMSTQVEGRLKRRFESRATGAEWVFPGRHGKGHLKEIRGALKEMGQDIGSPFMIHDLRRTFATMADEAGVPFEAIKRALNHKTGDVTAKYIISRADSMRGTFQKVADMVDWWAWKDPPGEEDAAPEPETVDPDDPLYA